MRRAAGPWSVASAKARFSELIDKAGAEGPQPITRNGRLAAVVVSAEEWERRTRARGSLAEFFAQSPLKGSGLDLERIVTPARDVDI